MALYILYYTLYVHKPFILSSVFKTKVHSLREAILSHYNKSLWFVQALFFLMCSQAWDWNGWHFLQIQHIKHTHEHTHTLILHGEILKRNLGNKRKREETLKREQTDVISSDESKCECATLFCLQKKETRRERPDCKTSPKTVSAGRQVAWLEIQKQLIHTNTIYFSSYYTRKKCTTYY